MALLLNTTVTGTLEVSGAVNFASTLGVTGAFTAGSVNGVTVTSGTNTFTITVGTASLVVPPGVSGTLGTAAFTPAGNYDPAGASKTLGQISDMSESARAFNALDTQDSMRRQILGAECVSRTFTVAPGGGAQPTLDYTASVYCATGTALGGDDADVRLPDIGDFQPGARVIIGDFLNMLASGGSITVLEQSGGSLPFNAKLTKPGQWLEIMYPSSGAATWVLIRRSSDLWSIKTAGFSLATDTRYQTALTAAASASLPASPVAGDWFEISDAGFGGGNGWDVWNLTIPCTTTKINNGTADFVCNVAAGGVRGVYINATTGWAIKGI